VYVNPLLNSPVESMFKSFEKPIGFPECDSSLVVYVASDDPDKTVSA